MKSAIARLTALALALLLAWGAAAPALAGAPGAPGTEPITILFTHDTHDHFYPDTADVGGYVRLATLLDRERAGAAYATFTLDAGDFSMGSPFQAVYATDAPELRALGAMGYDATTFGNHEYDYRPQGLANMLANAKKSGERLPAVVQANYNTAKDPSAQVAVDAMGDFPVTDYTVIEREGVRVAVFGVLGVDADNCAPMSGMVLEPIADAARRVVADIRAKEDPDYVICLSHTGTEKGKGEDYELAKAVDGIDLIISGHTHSTLPEPIVVNDTYIVSCGEYTQNLGRITLSRAGDKLTMLDYALIPVDSTIPEDPAMVARCESYKALVDENYLSNYGFSYDQALAVSHTDFTIPETGDYIGAAYIEAAKAVEGESYVPVAFAVAPDGVIRDVIRTGNITAASAFNILSLGVGADGTPGYPLLSIYLTGKDLKNAFEVDASVSPLMSGTCLYGAGSHWSYNPNRMFLDKVTDCWVWDMDPNVDVGEQNLSAGARMKLEDDKLYRVIADLYSGQMLSTVKEKSFGLLSITPRDATGAEIRDIEAHILHDADGNEVKAWYALAAYLQRQETVKLPAESKAVTPSWNPVGLLSPMGVPTLLVVLVGLVILALIVFIIYRIATRKRRKARKAAKKAAKAAHG